MTWKSFTYFLHLLQLKIVASSKLNGNTNLTKNLPTNLLRLKTKQIFSITGTEYSVPVKKKNYFREKRLQVAFISTNRIRLKYFQCITVILVIATPLLKIVKTKQEFSFIDNDHKDNSIVT